MGNTVNKQANIAFKIEGTETGRQEIDKLRTSLEGLGDGGKKVSQGFVDVFQNIERANDRVTKKITDGSVITERDGKVMIQQFELLKEMIDKTFGSVEKAPQEFQDAYKKAEAQFDSTTKKIRTATDAVDDQKEKLKEGGVAWTGIGDQLNKVLGKYGGLQVAALAAMAALKEGWEIGTSVAKAMGADVELTTQAWDAFSKSAGSVAQVFLTDGFSSGVAQMRAHFKNLGDTLFDSGAAMKNFNTVVGLGIDRVTALGLSTDDLKKIVDAYTLAQQGGAAGLKLFNDTVAQTDAKSLGEKLESMSGKFAELATKTKEASERTDELKKAQDAVKTSLEGVIQKIQDEIVARQRGMTAMDAQMLKYDVLKRVMEESEKILGAQEKDLGGVTLSMQILLQQISSMLPTYDQHTERINKANEGLKRLIELNETLTPEEKKRIESIEQQIEKYKDLDPATKFMLEQRIQEIVTSAQAKAAAEAHAEGLGDLAGKTKDTADESEKLNVKVTEGEAKLRKNTGAVDEHGKAIAKAKIEITSAGEVIDRTAPKFSAPSDKMKDAIPDMQTYEKMIGSIDTKLLSMANSLRIVNDALDRNKTAFAAAAGSGNGGGGTAPDNSPGGAGYLDSVPPAPEVQPGNDSGL
jgi:peptidoglycan hydrolase CwlO-like protein